MHEATLTVQFRFLSNNTLSKVSCVYAANMQRRFSPKFCPNTFEKLLDYKCIKIYFVKSLFQSEFSVR